MRVYTILIVDDELENLQAMYDVMNNAEGNYKIIRAINGKIAYEAAVKRHPDLIISDWDMPEMDGIELIKALKKNKETVDIPVIMCTGVMTTSENLKIALEAGAVDYIRKPIDAVEFIARTKANLHLADQYNEVKKLNESKDQIFSIISHDLRSPVGAIKALTDSVLKNKGNYKEEKMFKLFKDINKQISSTFYILENLLMWAQSQRKIISVDPQVLFVNNAVDLNVQVLEKAATNKGIQIQNNIPNDLKTRFDVNLISIVVRNLIANAIKFTPSGGSIGINVESGDAFHTISINDSGVGISPDRIEKLFDKSVFETTYGTNDERGSGIGLKLCKDFVEKHQGTIGVDSVMGEGSSFWFTLPNVN